MERIGADSLARRALQRVLALVAAALLTLLFFLLLPVIQAISPDPRHDTLLHTADTASLPPPPPPPEEEEPEEEEELEETPPEMLEEAPPLDLSQLELALNPGMGDGWMSSDFALKLNLFGGGKDDAGSIFGLDELDQRPRATYQTSPLISDKLRKKAPGTVYVLFVVAPDGRVEDPVVQKSTDPVFDAPALAAVKKWRFEPGKKNGEAVRFRMRVPITFPAP